MRAWVISVFSCDSSSLSSSRRNVARRILISSASALGPVNPRRWSSHYADLRIMPIKQRATAVFPGQQAAEGDRVGLIRATRGETSSVSRGLGGCGDGDGPRGRRGPATQIYLQRLPRARRAGPGPRRVPEHPPERLPCIRPPARRPGGPVVMPTSSPPAPPPPAPSGPTSA